MSGVSLPIWLISALVIGTLSTIGFLIRMLLNHESRISALEARAERRDRGDR